MALTRRMLTAMGIEAEKIDQIIEAHAETTEGLKKQAEELREQASKVPSLEKEIEDMRAAQPKEDWQAKYDELQKEFDGYKANVQAEQAEQEKARLYRSMLRESGVDEKRIDSIMKVTDLSGISVAEARLQMRIPSRRRLPRSGATSSRTPTRREPTSIHRRPALGPR